MHLRVPLPTAGDSPSRWWYSDQQARLRCGVLRVAAAVDAVSTGGADARAAREKAKNKLKSALIKSGGVTNTDDAVLAADEVRRDSTL